MKKAELIKFLTELSKLANYCFADDEDINLKNGTIKVPDNPTNAIQKMADVQERICNNTTSTDTTTDTEKEGTKSLEEYKNNQNNFTTHDDATHNFIVGKQQEYKYKKGVGDKVFHGHQDLIKNGNAEHVVGQWGNTIRELKKK